MRNLLVRRWPWVVSTLVHGIVVTALAFNLLDAWSNAASTPIQPIQIEMMPAPQIAGAVMPLAEEALPPEDTAEARKPEAIPAAEAVPRVDPIPPLAETLAAVPVETRPIPPPPPPKPAAKSVTSTVAKTSPSPAPPTEAPPDEIPQVDAVPAPVAPPQLAAIPPMAGRSSADADYFARVLAWLEKHKEYPRQAQIRRIQGTTVLQFELDRQGRVLSYRIKTSSGSPELDREVEAMIRRAEPLPPMPDDMTEAKLDLIVPVQFRLR